MSNDGIYVDEVTFGGMADDRFRNLEMAMRRALVIAGRRLVFQIVALQARERPGTVATGQTMRSHSVSQVYTGRDGGGEFWGVTVGPRTGYSMWGIETGRRAGTPPPLRRIAQWVREKPGGAGLSEGEIYAMAKKIQKTIAQTGTKAYLIMSEAALLEIPNIEILIGTSAAAALNGK